MVFLYNSFDINANVGMFFFTDNLSWLKCSLHDNITYIALKSIRVVYFILFTFPEVANVVSERQKIGIIQNYSSS